MKPLTIEVSFDGGEPVALGGIARYIVTPYWRGTVVGRKQNAPEANIPPTTAANPHPKVQPNSNHPGGRKWRGIPRAIASYARTG